jgi:hypothetical protein
MSKLATFALALIVSTPVFAQNVITIERKETWTIKEYEEVSRTAGVGTLEKLKTLPPGFHHFLPVVNPVQIYSDGMIVCREMKNAISFGKRLWNGDDPEQAVKKIVKDNGGDEICYNRPGLVLTSAEIAIRGDDKPGTPNRIYITKWKDQHGNYHFTGSPCHTKNCM